MAAHRTSQLLAILPNALAYGTADPGGYSEPLKVNGIFSPQVVLYWTSARILTPMIISFFQIRPQSSSSLALDHSQPCAKPCCKLCVGRGTIMTCEGKWMIPSGWKAFQRIWLSWSNPGFNMSERGSTRILRSFKTTMRRLLHRQALQRYTVYSMQPCLISKAMSSFVNNSAHLVSCRVFSADAMKTNPTIVWHHIDAHNSVNLLRIIQRSLKFVDIRKYIFIPLTLLSWMTECLFSAGHGGKHV